MVKNKLFWIIPFFCISSAAFSQNLPSSVYDWEKLNVVKTSTGGEKIFFKRPTRSLEEFSIKAVTLNAGKSTNKYQIEKGYDELIIIKEGNAVVKIDNEQKVLGERSVAVAPSGNKVTISNTEDRNLIYFSVRFRPYVSNNQVKSETIPPVFVDWNTVIFKPSEIGGRWDLMQKRTSTLKELEIHITTLKEGLASHSGHVHPDEEIILILRGNVEMSIRENHYSLGPGSLIFVTNDDLHGLRNSGKGECAYFAIRWLID